MKQWLAGLAVLLWAQAGIAAPARDQLPTTAQPLLYELELRPDAQALRFTAQLGVTLEIRQATSRLELNAAELQIAQASLDEQPARRIRLDAERQRLILDFARPLAPGRHRLQIVYAGRINTQPAGLFALDYATAKGQQRALYTQFEPADARRLLPCWDEPGIKARYTLSAVLPQAQMAVSNMPVVEQTPAGDGLKRVRFETSPLMSSYLLFFAAGDFERQSRMVEGVDLGVVVRRGELGRAQEALETAAQLLPYYNDYFGVKFPLPKLDMIAAAGSSVSFSAMENWGAILYFESAMLLDAQTSTTADRREVFAVIAHEMAHQWFGNLVTMQWWDDLWLNEGFAEWMQSKAAERLHPDWQVWLDAQGERSDAMDLDARSSAHAVVQAVADSRQADQAFDDITYRKGQAVIRMLEQWLGADVFRDGVRRYFAAHAYGNATTDALWSALAQAAGQPVVHVAHGFTLQPGVPMIEASRSGKALRLQLSRYGVDDSRKRPAPWQVPVKVASLGAGGEDWQGLVAQQPQMLPHIELPLVNAGQSGYFRTRYQSQLLDALLPQFAQLSLADQYALLDDSLALGYSGDQPLSDFLRIAAQCPPGSHPLIVNALTRRLMRLDDAYDGLPAQAAYRRRAITLLQPLLAAVGWDARDGEDASTPLARSGLITALGQFGDTAVIATANARYRRWLEQPQTLSGEARDDVLNVVVRNAGAEDWALLQAARQRAGSELDAQHLRFALTGVRDPALVRRMLEQALHGELPTTERSAMMQALAYQQPELVFDFVLHNIEAVHALLEPSARDRFVPDLAAHSADPALIARLRQYAARYIPASAQQSVREAEAAIRFHARLRRERLPALTRYLAQQDS